MANKNIYRIILSNEFLGVSKEISAPNRYELNCKIENHKRIWNDKINRELNRQNKEQMKNQAERLTHVDEIKVEKYKSIIKHIYNQTSKKYYNSLLENKKYKSFSTELIQPSLNQVYSELSVPNKSFLEKIFKSKLEKRLQKET